MRKALVTVPASTANLGPGFDCLALALDLRNIIEVEGKDAGVEVCIEGQGADQLPKDHTNLCLQAFQRVFVVAGYSPPDMIMRLTNRIPLGSGLGSSAAAIIGGLLAADALLGCELNQGQLLKMALEFEDHLDNASASLSGGLVAVVLEEDKIITQQIPIPDLNVVIILPEISLLTTHMRQVLPSQIPHRDAVYNLSHLTFTIAALREGDYERLGLAMKDKLHQPYRTPLIPGYFEAERAAYDAGAAAVTLSGAGPSMVAFARDNHGKIAQAMLEAFTSIGVEARQFILPVDHKGATVTVT